MASRKATVRRKEGSEMAAYNVSPGNFWDIGNYNRAVKRIPECMALNDDLVKMFNERADIEAKYSKKLTDWNARWTKHLEDSPMYATMKTAALGTLKEAEDRARIHMDCWSKIHDQVIESIKRHKESHYHKAFVGIKEAKDYDEEFAKAQKPWAVAYGKVHRAKKNYHSACKSQETASQSLSVANKDSEIPIDKIKKLEDGVRKAEKVVDTMKGKYQEKLSRIAPLNNTYEQEMRKVYDRWSKDEERRKDFIQRTLVDFHKAVNICGDNRLKECLDNQLNVAYSGKSQYDTNWWSENYGADMPRNWPKFEVYSSLEWHKWNSQYVSSSQKKNFRRYTTRPRTRPYSSRCIRAYSFSRGRKFFRRFTLTRSRSVSHPAVPKDSLSVHTINMDYLDQQLAMISKNDIRATLATTLTLPNNDQPCSSSARQPVLDTKKKSFAKSLFNLPVILGFQLSREKIFTQKEQSLCASPLCKPPEREPTYESLNFAEELGDVPDVPPPVSAIEPPPSQSYQTQSSYQQNDPPPPSYQQNQPPPQHIMPPQQSMVTPYEPSPDPESNPFMNGDAKDGFDDGDDWDEPPPIPGGGIPVRALYDYTKIEDDELSFNAGDILTKITEEDEQGWCRGKVNGLEGLYPANYVESI